MKEKNCYKCEYRGSVAGSCHSSCTNKEAIVKRDPRGIQGGWCNHPLNFDPVWIDDCTGFKEKSI